jgi:BirA family biotin operon repressor/biotin-[acetyl-CoA-carboxylase] ligase
MLLRPEADQQEPGRWALLAGLALHQALSPFAPGIVLKWPNDLLLGAGKLAGILIDSQWEAGRASWVVIGIGANLAHAPDIADRPAARLPGPAPSPTSIAADILRQIDLWRARDMAAISQAWLARAHPLGTLLDVRAPQRRIAGVFAGLSPRGELLLEGCDAPISSAEIWPAQGAQSAAATGMPG